MNETQKLLQHLIDEMQKQIDDEKSNIETLHQTLETQISRKENSNARFTLEVIGIRHTKQDTWYQARSILQDHYESLYGDRYYIPSEPYQLIDKQPTDVMTGSIHDIYVAPKRVMEVFGDRYEATGQKVSRCWNFVDADGRLYQIRDWKCTSTYEPYLPSPDDFWQSDEPEYIDICSDTRLSDEKKQAFVQWVKSKLKGKRD